MKRAAFGLTLLLVFGLFVGCSGIRAGAELGVTGMGDNQRTGIGQDKGRIDVMVGILDASGLPVTGKTVTMVTSRNEVRTAVTTGPEDSDNPQSSGLCLFAGIRGGVQSLTVFVSGFPFLFSELDLYKGWDAENNVINLVVYMRNGQAVS
jgi:hypothetical protein